MASYYLIDYENVHNNGFIGINKLTNKDFVVVFTGNVNGGFPDDAIKALMNTKANIIHNKIQGSGKNYLDMQLASYLGSLVGTSEKNDYHIISKDKGFNAVINFWGTHKQKIVITLQETIEGKAIAAAKAKAAVKENKQTKQVEGILVENTIWIEMKKHINAILKKYNISSGNFNKVTSIISKSKDDVEFVETIFQTFGAANKKNYAFGNDLLPAFHAFNKN